MGALACTDVQLALLEGNASKALLEHAHVCRDGCRLVLELSGLLDAASSGARPATDVSLPAGKILDRYELEDVIGHGGQGVVCRARDLETEEIVAIKFLPLEHREGKVLELRLARRVTHPNVCRVHDTQIDGRNRLIIMEHVAGPALAAVRDGLSQADALRIFQGICAGVHAAHEAGVLHLDLTPSNVLLRGGKEPVVTDFGLSVALEDGARALGGTTGYMAPEQQRHERVDRRTDVYALGQLLRSLVGAKSRRLRGVIRRATQAEPERRYATVDELARALDAPVRWWWALGIFGVVVMGGILTLRTIEPPGGPRVRWLEAIWGPDPLPLNLWNVARVTDDDEVLSLQLSHSMFACGNKPRDLFDGLAFYANWDRGVAFPQAPMRRSPTHSCVDLALMGGCGTLEPDDILCEDIDGDDAHRVLPYRGRDIDLSKISTLEGTRLGKLVPRIECGERSLTLTLGRERQISAVRAWFHDVPPALVWVALKDPSGETLKQIRDSTDFTLVTYEPSLRSLDVNTDVPGERFMALPVTFQFSPATANEVSLAFDTCTSLDPADFERYLAGEQHKNGTDIAPQVGWLYELEVFAEPEWYEAWYWHLVGS